MYEVKISKPSFTYSSEKIDDFIETAKKAIQLGKTLYSQYKTLILSITLSDVVNNIEKYKELLSDMSSNHNELQKTYDKLYNVVEMYDYTDMPDNVKKLDSLIDSIDNITLDIYYLKSALESIIGAGEDLNKQYFTK